MRDNKPIVSREDDVRVTELLEDYYSRLEIPEGAPAWELMKERLEESRLTDRRRRRFQSAAIAACVMLLMQGFLWLVQPVQAITGFYIKVHQNETATSIEIGTKVKGEPVGMLTDPPPADLSQFGFFRHDPEDDPYRVPMPPPKLMVDDSITVSTVEEAQKLVDFEIMVPSYVPDKLPVREVRIVPSNEDGGIGYVETTYRNENLEPGAPYLRVMQFQGGGDFHKVVTISDPNGVVKELKFGDRKGYIFISSEIGITMEWSSPTHTYQVRGMVSEEEAVRFAKSFK